MRNKQRPIKSNRHKSVTSMIDCPEISFQREERHGVMRLAFFENNDITPETWKDFDFNTLSTLILNRNIHHDLQGRNQHQHQHQQEPTDYATPYAAQSPISAPINISPPSPQAPSPQPVYSPAPVFVRKPSARVQSSASASRPVIDAASLSSAARIAHMVKSERASARSTVQSKPTNLSKPASVQRSTGIPPHKQQLQHNQHQQQQQHRHPPNRHHQQQQQQQQQQRSTNSVESTILTNHSGQYLCEEPDCGKTFPSLRKLRHHKVVHSDEFPFMCRFQGCGKRFKRKFGIDLHSTTHFDLDPEMYGKTSNNSSLAFFGRRMQYSMCKPCNQKFKTVHDYQDHMLRHGKEPFKCLVEGCGQTFSIWKSFQKHRASHYFNYFCKMDPECSHSTSNLQLLKLHIYCCHFRRTLPENATLSREHNELHDKSVDQQVDDQSMEEEEEAEEADEGEQDQGQEREEMQESEQEALGEKRELTVKEESERMDTKVMDGQEAEDPLSQSQGSDVSTPRRDPRLRRNPPRSSTFGHQDYASISNGSSFAKLTSPQSIRRARPSSSQPNSADKKAGGKSPAKVLPRRACASTTSSGSQYSTPEKKAKTPLKVLPKRSAQRLPMSLIAAEEGSTEDDDCSDISSARAEHCNVEGESGNWEQKFKCHLCDYKFSVRFQLTKHLSTHLELSPDMYSATADAKVIQLTERRRREFYCDKCTDKCKFEKMSDLDTHMRKHGPRPYVCPFCPMPSTFKMAKQYLSHLYEHRFKYSCTMDPNCDFTINRKDALKLHIFRMHLNQQLPAYIENFASMGDCGEWTE